jgi:hypothetical protein
MVAEFDWDDMDSLRQDFASPLGQEIASDVDQLASWCRTQASHLADITVSTWSSPSPEAFATAAR